MVGDLKHGRTVHSLARLVQQKDSARPRIVNKKKSKKYENTHKFMHSNGIFVEIFQ